MKSATLFKLRDSSVNKERDPFYIKILEGDNVVYLNFYGEKIYGNPSVKDVIRWLADGQVMFTELDFVFPVKVKTYTWEEMLQNKGLYQAVGGHMVGAGYDIFVPVRGTAFCYNLAGQYLSTPVSDWHCSTYVKKDINSIEVKF